MTRQTAFTAPAPAPSRRADGYTKRLLLGAAVLCIIWLAGCMPNVPSAETDPATRYPFQVESTLVTQPVVFQDGAVTLDQTETARVDQFVTQFLRGGGGFLDIRVATTDSTTEARLQALRRAVLNRGARPEEIRVSRIAGASKSGGPLILSFEQYTAKTITCDRRHAPTAYNPTNLQHPDMGCALRSNVAAMVANPADLEGPQAEQPGDSMRRSRVIQNYRAGQPTEATRGDSENAGSIRDLGG